MQILSIIDSHTGGEPTRLIVEGGPDLGLGPLAERRARFSAEYDAYRRATVNEPRGSDVLVGALLCTPHAPDCQAGVIFFNNVGTLGMCGHGMMGVVVSLAHRGLLGVGRHRIDTPVGVVDCTLHEDGSVSLVNVPAYRTHHAIALEVPGLGCIHGDIAWGGNWFFLVEDHGQTLDIAHVHTLSAVCANVRAALEHAGICAPDGAPIDHIELFGAAVDPANDSRNFVYCPGGAYDRSPCGTGTSAKLACLAASGKLAAGALWRQESIIGSVFEGYYLPTENGILPHVRGRAYVNAEARLLIDPRDPFAWGITPAC